MTPHAKSLFILMLTVSLIFLICSGGLTANPDPPFTITESTLATGVNPFTYLPYAPTDTFLESIEAIYLTVSFTNAQPDSILKVAWLNLATDTIIGDYALKVSGSKNAYFYVTQPKNGWIPGSYHAQIYYNEQLVQTIPFQIIVTQPITNTPTQPKNSEPASNLPVEETQINQTDPVNLFQIITEYTLTKEVDPDTYRPLSPTNRFNPDQPYLYLSISTLTAPAHSQLQIQWSYIGQETFIFAEQKLEIEDNDTAYFSLSKPDAGWPIGLYKVSIYLNGELFDTLPFRVVKKSPNEYIQSVCMTYEVTAQTFTPVNVTYLFFSSDPEIHLLVTFVDLPKDTSLKVLWYYYDEGKRYLVAETPTTGSGDDTVDFWVESPEGGFWVGKYEAELYLDGKLYTTVPFQVIKI